MADVIVAATRVNNLVIYYCKANNLRLIGFGNKVPIDSKYAELYHWARKVIVFNKLNNTEEIYLFLGKKATIHGYYATDIRKIS